MINTAGRPASEVSLALSRLAELQLNRLNDIPAARATYERIATDFPHTEAALTAKAHLMEPIFARLFLGTSPWNLASRGGLKCPEEPDLDYQLIFRIGAVNGTAAGDILVTKPITENLFKSGTSFSIADGADDALNDAKVVFPRDAWGDAMSNPKNVDYHFAAQLVPRLHEGSNQVTFSALATCGKLGSEVEIAVGSLELEVGPGEKEHFWAVHGPTVKPFPAKEFAKLEPTGRQVYRDHFGGEPVRMFAVSDWGYPQNLSGVVTRRQVSVAALEQKDGACRIVQFGLEQGASGPHRFDGEVHLTAESPGGPQPFPCSTVASAR